MSYKDYTKTRSSIAAFDSNAIWAQLMDETCKRIHALKIFYSVGPKVRVQEAIRCPACIVTPNRMIIAEQHLAGARFNYKFYVNIAFALKHPNDCIIMQQALYLEEKIRVSFSKSDSGSSALVFNDVNGHYNTIIETTAIEPIELISNKVLAINSGINIVFSVWQSL